MNSLLNQVNTRLDEVSLLSVAEQTIQAQTVSADYMTS